MTIKEVKELLSTDVTEDQLAELEKILALAYRN